MSEAQQTMVGTIPVEERDRLDLDRLATWMETHVDGFAGPLAYAKFAGGQSNPTYRLDTPIQAAIFEQRLGPEQPLRDRINLPLHDFDHRCGLP